MSNNHHEDDQQKYLFQESGYCKELKWLFAIPNGGKRDAREGKRLKLQGVKAGVHDTFLPKARGIYHGAYVELKHGKNKLSDKQKDFAKDMIAEGYCSFTCYSAAEAMKAIKMYLRLKSGESISEACSLLSSHHIKP